MLRRNWLLKHIIEGKIEGRIEVTGRRGRRRKQVLDDLQKNRGYWKLKEDAFDWTLWGTDCGWGCGTLVRQAMKWIVPFCIHLKQIQLPVG